MWRIYYKTQRQIHLGFQLASRLWSSIWSPSGRSGKSQGWVIFGLLAGGGRSLEVRKLHRKMLPGDFGICQQEPAYSLPLCCTWRSFEGRPVLAFTGGGKCRKKPAKQAIFSTFWSYQRFKDNSADFLDSMSPKTFEMEKHAYITFLLAIYTLDIFAIYTHYIWFLRFKFIHIHIIYINCCPLAWPSLVVWLVQPWAVARCPTRPPCWRPNRRQPCIWLPLGGQISENPRSRNGFFMHKKYESWDILFIYRHIYIYIHVYRSCNL